MHSTVVLLLLVEVNLLVVVSKSEANSLVSRVEDSVVLAHEDITQDPERTGGGRDVHAHETQHAEVAIGNEIVVGGQHVVLQ